MSKAAGDSVTVVKVASEAGLGLETEVSVSNAEVLALMRMSIGKAEVFADVAEAYARVLADRASAAPTTHTAASTRHRTPTAATSCRCPSSSPPETA